jgi:hypothetical protein
MSVTSGDLRAYLRFLAGWVWHEQDAAFDFGLSLQEETLTEMLLLKMAKDCSPLGLQVQMFNKAEEGKNGADWEWFFDGPECSVGFRVQAKVLKRSEQSHGRYKQLGIPSSQTQKLIDDAKKGGFNPVYLFYNHPRVKDHHLFGKSVQPDWFGRSCWGCSVATAEFVKTLPDNKLATVMQAALPWHRFFRMGKACGTAAAMSRMPGGQDLIPAFETPDWVSALQEFREIDDERRRERIEPILEARNLQGVALITYRPEE